MVHYPKGSPEARAHMAQLRSMRVKGGSLRSVVKSMRRGIKHGSHILGQAAQQAKQYVPKQYVKQFADGAISAATNMVGRPDLGASASRALNAGVDSAYRTNLAKGSVGKNFAANYRAAGGQPLSAMAKEVTGSGVRRRVKGGAVGRNSGAYLLTGTDKVSGKFMTNKDNVSGARLPSKISLIKGAGFLPAGVGYHG